MAKTILITGASSGIGAATAQKFLTEGWNVAMLARRLDKLESVANGHANALIIACDVTDEASVITAFSKAADHFGAIDALFNNAGIFPVSGRFDLLTLKSWQASVDVNLTGMFLCAREAVRRMSTRHGGTGGAIVNVSSGASRLGSPGEYVDYAASKGAVDSLTIGLAKEVAAESIRVNAVRPGFIYTDIHASGGEPDRVDRVKAMVPMARGGQPIEVARAILWLLSDEASYATGTFLDITGGK